MACLVHNPCYRSLFHGVVNELRNEKTLPVHILRCMPRQCCTCDEILDQTLITVAIDDIDQLKCFKKLNDKIDRNKCENPKLCQSLNQLKSFIRVNRTLNTNSSLEAAIDIDMNGSNNDSISSDEDLRDIIKRRKFLKKPTKITPLKNGTFIFLTYKFDDISDTHDQLAKAKQLQRGRFIGRKGYITSLEKEYNVCINMVTAKTSKQMGKTLENAKAGIGNVKVHNSKDLTSGLDGEWILVRAKKVKEEIDEDSFEKLFRQIIDRWERLLKAKKRKIEDDDDEEEDQSNKK